VSPSLTITEAGEVDGARLNPHPGEILREEFLVPLGLTASRLARDLRISPARVGDLLHGRRAIRADLALRLAQYLGTSPQLWLNLQSAYDLALARDLAGETIAAEITPLAAPCAA
jgi:antitoxin HigA-1